MKRGFSLVELLIVLSVVVSLIGVATPLALNSVKKARAAAVASDFNAHTKSLKTSIYLDESLPASIDRLGRNTDRAYGVAWSKNGSDYEFVIFTDREVDTKALAAILPDSGKGFPSGRYEFLAGGLSNTDLSSAYYRFSSDGSSISASGALVDYNFSLLEGLPFISSPPPHGTWTLVEGGLSSQTGKGKRNKGILESDESMSDYEIDVVLQYIDPDVDSKDARGYKVLFRAQGNNANSAAGYYLDFAPVRPRLVLQELKNGYAGNDIAYVELKELGGSDWKTTLNNTVHTLKIVAKGSQFKVYFNGIHALSASDSTFESGRVGLETYGNVKVIFKSVTIRSL
jgi:prepilin-type N-terminal cleavage/methylation domain-containing protein